jgi:hypothetical protein
MATKRRKSDEATPTELAEGILGDVRTLIGQHFDLLRHEVREEIDRVKDAAISAAAGTGLLALGGVLATHMAVHLVHRATRLPLWASFGLVGVVCGGAGYGLLARARSEAGGVSLGLPPQTQAALREDVAWLQGQKSASPA